MRKKSSKKVKQVAARARTKPARPSSGISSAQNLYTGQGGIDAIKQATVTAEESIGALQDATTMPKAAAEFFDEERPQEELKREALDLARKVGLKENIRSTLAAFSARIDAKIDELSKRVEAQLQPLVRAVAEAAVAKKELAQELVVFGEELNALLNLNEEHDAIDIEKIFLLDEDDQSDTFLIGHPSEMGLLDEAAKEAVQGAAIAIAEADYAVN